MRSVRDPAPTVAPATPRASSRNALIDAALDEFSELGYEAATVSGIAETGDRIDHFTVARKAK